jgi:cob(I)alamin adenosyltransferase
MRPAGIREDTGMRKKGLIHAYCGDGKGKTTCGMGLCLRAAGAGCRVLIYQFMKDGRGHERNALEKLPNVTFANQARDVSFSFRMSADEKEKEKAFYRREMERITDRVHREAWDVLFLDEVLYAVRGGLLEESVLTDFLDTKPQGLEVILTGRELSDAVRARADYLSRIVKEKHPYDAGVLAREGIEY